MTDFAPNANPNLVDSPSTAGISSAADCLARVRSILLSARHQALQTVNAAMVQAYWQIGREIVEEEQRGNDRADYGARLIDELSTHLSHEFGRGFIPRNLRYMREFYNAFPIWNAVRSELSWTHNRMLSGVSKPKARDFYAAKCAKDRGPL